LESGIVGGKVWLAPRIENFPGFEFGLKGSELVEKMRLHALRFHAEINENEEVIGLELSGGLSGLFLESKRIRHVF
jgi:thioredoxin reductase